MDEGFGDRSKPTMPGLWEESAEGVRGLFKRCSQPQERSYAGHISGKLQGGDARSKEKQHHWVTGRWSRRAAELSALGAHCSARRINSVSGNDWGAFIGRLG